MVAVYSTFIKFIFEIPTLSVNVIHISWETCYWKVCFQFCGQIFLNKCGGYFFILKNSLLNIFFLFLLCLKKFFFFVFLCGKINFSNKLMETSKQIQLYAFLKLNLLSAPVFFFKVPTYFSFCSLEFFDTRWNLLKMLNIRNQKAAEQSINAIKSWQLALVIDFTNVFGLVFGWAEFHSSHTFELKRSCGNFSSTELIWIW